MMYNEYPIDLCYVTVYKWFTAKKGVYIAKGKGLEYKPGDRLWVREDYYLEFPESDEIKPMVGYANDYNVTGPGNMYLRLWERDKQDAFDLDRHWYPKESMPREYSRMTLLISSVNKIMLGPKSSRSKKSAVCGGGLLCPYKTELPPVPALRLELLVLGKR